MKTENCREWRESLGAYALGHLSADEQAGLEAHLEGCAECRAEVQSLQQVATLLPHADPERFGPSPQPPKDLGERILATLDGERREQRRHQRRLRFGFAFGGAATALAVAVLALVVFTGGGGEGEPEQHVEFSSLPAGVEMAAMLEPHAYGTEIHMYVSGIRSGTLCRVFLRADDGARYPAGTFRYRWGDDSNAILSSALDLSRTAAIGVHAGDKTFIAPVDRSAAAIQIRPEEEET
ncbi:MAG TPA: zf-HC2 domain-containing protein [Solirubrobacterales bacterium]|nr:zf-HC2 domain-containing protein [Solirubrobacterales bacterium]